MASPEELEQYESDMELALYREYRDVLTMFTYAVETERRFYLANEVSITRDDGQAAAYEVELTDAWVWDMYRPARFVSHVRVVTFHDINVEQIAERGDDDLPAYPPSSLAEDG